VAGRQVAHTLASRPIAHPSTDPSG
jgi:hypothetical protein